MDNDTASWRTGPETSRAPQTYTILLRDFAATVAVAGRDGRTDVRINLKLTVTHPGRGFPDDIRAVMSYEDIVEDLRRLCAEEAIPGPDYLADRIVDLCLIHDKVRRVRVDVELIFPEPGTGGAGASLTRTRME